jgi:hypothetical protein
MVKPESRRGRIRVGNVFEERHARVGLRKL